MDTASQPEIRVPGKKPWRVIFRVLLLLATAVSLYFLFPSLVDLFTQWHSLAHLKPEWLLLALVFEATSVTALWEVQRIALRTPSWFAVGTSQLAGNAAGNVIPGGAATSGAFTYRLLVRAGVRRDDVAAGLASVSIRSARGGPSLSARSSPSRASTISASSAAWPRSAPGRIHRSSCSPTRAGCCSR